MFIKIEINRLLAITSLLIILSLNTANGVTYKDYDQALIKNQKIKIEGLSHGDGKELDALLFKPKGKESYPALVALHGAGGIFPYQLWWAHEIAKQGYVVLFVDHYCTREHLCDHASDDTDKNRGEAMRHWRDVSPRQRVLDAAAAYMWLSKKTYVKGSKIGIIGWSWGGASALFAQKIADRMSLPKGGFKATIAFYPNLKYLIERPEWTRTGPIKQPTLILYGKADKLESSEAYQKLLSSGYPASIKVIGFAGAYKKFDELGPDREKYHPSVGYFSKGFQQKALDVSVSEVRDFLEENLK